MHLCKGVCVCVVLLTLLYGQESHEYNYFHADFTCIHAYSTHQR